MEKSIHNSKVKPANGTVRANYNGGVVITLVKNKVSSHSLVTVIGNVDLNSWPVLGLIVPILVPMREPKSIFALETNIRVAPSSLLAEIAASNEYEDDDIEEEIIPVWKHIFFHLNYRKLTLLKFTANLPSRHLQN